jgi:hypothetical protein
MFDETGALTGGGPVPITGIPAGTQCEVEETSTGGATSVGYAVDGNPVAVPPPTVTIASGATVTVSVTNSYLGELDVEKLVVGDPGGSVSFTVAVDCDVDAFDDTLMFDETGALTGGGPVPITGIPAGTQCEVEETSTGGATSVGYAVDGNPVAVPPPTVTIASGATVTVSVTNSYLGSLQVVKVVNGTPDPGEGFPFVVDVDCLLNGNPVTLPGNGVLTFNSPADSPQTIDDIPAGSECTAIETDDGDADLVIVTPVGGVTITTGPPAEITVDNIFVQGSTVGSLSVQKTVVGDFTPSSSTSFVVHVSCTDGTDTDLTIGSTGGVATVLGIQILAGGTDCTVTEPTNGGASIVSFTPTNGQLTLTVANPAQVVGVQNAFCLSDVQASSSGQFASANMAATFDQAVGGLANGAATNVVAQQVNPCPEVAGISTTLPFTGTTIGRAALAGGVLLLVGIPAALLTRRRRRISTT